MVDRSERGYMCRSGCPFPSESWDAPSSSSSIHVSVAPETSGADRTSARARHHVLVRSRWSGRDPMRSCLHGLRAGGPGQDRTNQNKDRTVERVCRPNHGSPPRLPLSHCHRSSNRHNHHQRKLCVHALTIVKRQFRQRLEKINVIS